MGKKGSLKITSSFVVLSLLVAILPVYSLDRPEECVEEISDQCIGFKMFSIDANNADYAILEVKGEGVQTYEDSVIKQENAEGSRTPSTQSFICNGKVTKIEIYINSGGRFGPVKPYPRRPGVRGGIIGMPAPSIVSLQVKTLNNTVLYQGSFEIFGGSSWLSFNVPDLELNGTYKLQVSGGSWYYGSGYSGGSADFNSNKDFCFRIHCKKEKTVYPETVKYKTDLMDSWETIATNLQNGTETITIPKENIDGATELLLSSQNNSQSGSPIALTKISWNLKVFHKVPETPAKLSLPFIDIEGEDTTFQILYTDLNNDSPLSAKIYVNDVEYDLANEDSYQWNGSLYSITLPYQECNYYFIFDNGKETIRMPEEEAFYIGGLEKKMSEWKENIEEESILIDQELQKIDLYYIQENYDPQILKSLMDVKLDQIKKTAKNYRFMKDIHYLASQREEIMSFENLTDVEIDEAFAEIQNEFPEELRETFRDYGMTDDNIEQLRTDILENKDVIKEKRILSNFMDLKENYVKIALLNIESFSNTSYRYFEKYNYVYNPLPEKKQIVLNAWNALDDLNPDINIMKTKSLEIIQTGEVLVENGNFQYVDDINAALVYYFVAETGDPEPIQELASNFEIYNSICDCEKTLQVHFNYAKTVKFNTVNGRDTIDNIKIIIRPPGVDYPLMPIKKQSSTENPTPCRTCKTTTFAINETPEGMQGSEEQVFADVPIDCDGVPDSDNDGWCDTIDPCPNTPGVNCPESDIDHDGIPDDEDDCPNDPGTSYYNGCPAPGEEDTDGDGVPDTYDHCPNQAGPASNNGCPLPENCLCKDDPEVKELLDDLSFIEGVIKRETENIEKTKYYIEMDIGNIDATSRRRNGYVSAMDLWILVALLEMAFTPVYVSTKIIQIGTNETNGYTAKKSLDSNIESLHYSQYALDEAYKYKTKTINRLKQRCPCAV